MIKEHSNLVIKPVESLIDVFLAVGMKKAGNFGYGSLNFISLKVFIFYISVPLVRFEVRLDVLDEFCRFVLLELIFNRCDLIQILLSELNMRIIINSLYFTEVLLGFSKPILIFEMILRLLMNAGNGEKEISTCLIVVLDDSVVNVTKECFEFGLQLYIFQHLGNFKPLHQIIEGLIDQGHVDRDL